MTCRPGQPTRSGSLRRTRAIITKELKHIWLDPGSLFLTILAPGVLLTLLAYVFSFDVNGANLAIIDRDLSAQSRDYVRTLTADGDLNIAASAASYDEVVKLFQTGQADAALIIPPGFGERLTAREQAPVNLVVDGSDTGTAFQVMNAIEQRTLAYSNEITGPLAAPFDVRMRVWFNANLSSQHSMVPGLMALVLILPPMALALSSARERESGTFETIITTPVQGREYLIGKLIVYLLLGLVGAILALAVAVYWFDVPFRGSLPLYLLLTADYLFSLMGFCLLVAHFVRSQRAISSIIILLLFIPGFFLTGLLLPINRRSIMAQAMAFTMPGTHFMVISRGVMLKGIGMGALGIESLVLLGMGVLALAVAVGLFAKKLR